MASTAQLAIQHQATPDAGAQRHHQEARILLTPAVERLTKRGHGGVVLHDHGATDPTFELALNVHAREAGHVGELPARTGAIDLTWDREADAGGDLTERSHCACDGVEHLTRTGARVGVHGLAAQDAPTVDDARLDARSSHVHTDVAHL